MRTRNLAILGLLLTSLLVFWPSLKTLVVLAVQDDRYLQTILAPVTVTLLLYWRRTEIFSHARYSTAAGIPLLSLAMLLGFVAVYHKPDSESAGLLLASVAITAVWIAGFVLCYGVQSFRAGFYPLCCLLLMIPLPPSWMDGINGLFQQGSAALTYRILSLSGFPVLRHGMQFSLPGLTFEVAPECSGIRSSLALLVVAIVAGYVYLRSAWTRLALIALTIPIVLFKNAVRIVAITTLGAYVNRLFIDGPFHRYGGILFSIVGVVLFVVALVALLNMEARGAEPNQRVGTKNGSPMPGERRSGGNKGRGLIVPAAHPILSGRGHIRPN